MRGKNRTDTQSPYATGEDFDHIFNQNLDELSQLAFLLGADHNKAEQALVTGLQESVMSNQVFKQWAHSWAKRAVIKNAIRLLEPQPSESESVASSVANKEQCRLESGDFELARLLALEPFQRFVFVMSALERYSDTECALLLGCSVREIQNARVRASNEIFGSTHEHPATLQVRRFLNDLLDGASSESRNVLTTAITH
jgi:DNA-directed RNA polymerase specialized sigma24 family protein